ncbi:hypothetical protein AAMO2058_001262000 [Amorphochlora amoebiformis]
MRARTWLLGGLLLVLVVGFETVRKKGSKNKKSSKPGNSGGLKKTGKKASPSTKSKTREKKTSPRKSSAKSYIRDGTFTYELEHSIEAGEFTKRGSVTIKLSRSSKNKGDVSISEFEFDKETTAKFKDLISEHKYYRLRLTKPGNASTSPMASVKACALEMSNFLEAFTFNMDPLGNIIAFDYLTPVVTCATPKIRVSEGTKFKSKGRVAIGKEGVRPDLTKLILAEKKGPPPKSFLQKYWIYILIAVVVLFSAGG